MSYCGCVFVYEALAGFGLVWNCSLLLKLGGHMDVLFLYIGWCKRDERGRD